MEKIMSHKRRSDESPFIPQSKKRINEKLLYANDTNKMKEIHVKTMDLLFKAARNLQNIDATVPKNVPLCQQFVIAGNGVVQFAKSDGTVLSIEQKKSECCDHKAYIRDYCSNCSQRMCEFCGYSCEGCGIFLCHSCVLLFGCGTIDRPICEKCAFYD